MNTDKLEGEDEVEPGVEELQLLVHPGNAIIDLNDRRED